MAANAYPCILYDNRFTDGAPAATDTATGYSALNVMDWRPFTLWKGASSGLKRISVDCADSKSADTLAIVGHNLGTAGAYVQVETSVTGAWTGEQAVRLSSFLVSSDVCFLKTFTSASSRYWSVVVVTAAIAAQIGVICLGSRLDFPRYPSGNFDPYPETVNADSARSKVGHLLQVARQNVGVEIAWQFKNITPAWVEASFRPAWDAHLSLGKPFIAAWDRTNHSTEAYYVAIPSGFTLSMPFDPYRRSINLKMEGIKET